MGNGVKPTALTIRSYQVGFGDCFLLKFHYAPDGTRSRDRHVLVDFGSTATPKSGAPKDMMKQVAQHIAAECGGRLDAVVATHRHSDHISGFATGSDPKTPGNVIRGLKPRLVVQPWTEDPKVEKDARKARVALPGGNLAMVRGLVEMQGLAAQVLNELDRRHDITNRLKAEIRFVGEDALKNLSAVKNLMTMSAKREYVYYGAKTSLQDLLPGVKVYVLGPPTREQLPDVEKQRKEDTGEFWHLQAAAVRRAAATAPLFPRARRYSKKSDLPAYARWFAPRIDRLRGEQLLQIVRAMDGVLNNTSVILLLEAGNKKFLFPGDAQIENWSYALKHAPNHEAVQKKLADVDFYKVGHHGSLNATPKTLWGLFKKRSEKPGAGRLCTMVSTLGGKHGKKVSGTEVPRQPLVDALKRFSDFYCTEDLAKKNSPNKLFYEVNFKL